MLLYATNFLESTRAAEEKLRAIRELAFSGRAGLVDSGATMTPTLASIWQVRADLIDLSSRPERRDLHVASELVEPGW
jgi:hypothetical protein